MKVLWLTNIPSPYRVDFFNELGKLCDLTVLFEKRSADDRDNSWKTFRTDHFTSVFLKGIRHGACEAFCPSVTRFLHKKKYDKIVVTNYSNPTGILAIATMKLRRIPYIIEGDGAFAGSGKGLKEKLKTWLLSGASQCFSTADEHDTYYRTYGVSEERIVRYPFTSLKDIDVLPAPISPEEKTALRSKLGMTENTIVLSVGRFIPLKGFDILFDALAQLDRSIGCYIVGGQPTEEYLQQINALKLENVHFEGFKQRAELAQYYKAADAFVLPTRKDIWGLVINEAMAHGLPVITTDRCVAGLELIKSEKLGALVPVDDAAALAAAIHTVLTDDSRRDAHAVLDAIRPYTIEGMAKRHMDIWSND